MGLATAPGVIIAAAMAAAVAVAETESCGVSGGAAHVELWLNEAGGGEPGYAELRNCC